MDSTALISELASTLDKVIAVLANQNDVALEKLTRPGAWTIGQLAWHIVLASGDMANVTTKPADRPYDRYVNDIRTTFLNDSIKMKSPEFLVPENKTYQVATIVGALRHNKDAQLKILREKDITELVMDVELPVWGNMSRYEWAKLMVYHVQRHTKQLEGYLRK